MVIKQQLQVANCKYGEQPPGNLAITSIECYMVSVYFAKYICGVAKYDSM